MKRQYLYPLSFVIVLLATLWVSCSKHHSDDNSNSTVTLITQTSWKYDTSGIDLNKDGIVDIGGDTLITACEKDDVYTFVNGGSGTIDEGATKCKVSDPQTISFNWTLLNNNTVLDASAPPLLTGNINIFSTSSTKFVLYKDTAVSGISVRYIVALKH